MNTLYTTALAVALCVGGTAAQQLDSSFVVFDTEDTGILRLAAGDVDGDGFDDLVVDLDALGTLRPSVALSTEPGGFGPLLEQAVAYRSIQHLVDVDGDGDVERVTVELLSASPSSSRVHVDDFVGTSWIEIGALDVDGDLVSADGAVELGDIDGDGLADLATSPRLSNIVTLWLADGSGGFTLGTTLDAGALARDVAIGDIDGDGLADVVAAVDAPGATVRVARQQPGGTFTAFEIVPGLPQGFGLSVEVLDFDGEGPLDVLAQEIPFGGFQLLQGQDGALPQVTAPIDIGFGVSIALVVADVDDDGRDEVLTGSRVIDWDDGTITLTWAPDFRAALDADRDGFTDLLSVVNPPNLLLSDGGPWVGVFGGSGDVSQSRDHIALEGRPRVVADVDGDGRPDLLASSSQLTSSLRRGGPFGAFAPSEPLAVRGAIVGSEDLDGDGVLDLVTITEEGPTLLGVRASLGAGDGTFVQSDLLTVETVAAPTLTYDLVRVVEVTGDGIPDIVVGGVNPLAPLDVRTFAGAGDGTFTLSAVSRFGGGFGFAEFADVDADGLADVLIAVPGGIGLHRNVGAGAFGASEVVAPSPGLQFRFSAVDVTSDGLVDLVLTYNDLPIGSAGVVAVHRGRPDGTFGTAETVESAPFMRDAVFGDVDRDGDTDLVLSGGSIGSSRGVVVHLQEDGGLTDGVIAPQFALRRLFLADVDVDGRVDLLGGVGNGAAIMRFDDANWQRVGDSLAGPGGFSSLRADGNLTPGTQVEIDAPNGPPNAPVAFVLGYDALDLPAIGGVLVPTPDRIVSTTTDADGRATLTIPWPIVPPDVELYVQAWYPTAPASTIALRGTTLR